MKPQCIVTNNIYALSYYLQFKNDFGSKIVDSGQRISESHFIIAYFSRQFSHVSAANDIGEDIARGKVLYKGEEGIIIKE
jgi:hypothetical protein